MEEHQKDGIPFIPKEVYDTHITIKDDNSISIVKEHLNKINKLYQNEKDEICQNISQSDFIHLKEFFECDNKKKFELKCKVCGKTLTDQSKWYLHYRSDAHMYVIISFHLESSN